MMYRKYLFYLFLVILVSCAADNSGDGRRDSMGTSRQLPVDENTTFFNTDSAMALLGLVPVNEEESGIRVDLRYASQNNFMGKVLYDTLRKAYLQSEILGRLKRCQQYLDSLHPGYHLLVFDAVRPLNVQREMWNALDTVPLAIRGKYVSNPASGSVHNFGAAVDLTIIDAQGTELDMGAGYDDFRAIAEPSKEAVFLKNGELTKEQYANRVLLRKVMRSEAFSNIPGEWWHFNAFNRYVAERRFPMLLSESGNYKGPLINTMVPSSEDSLSDTHSP